MPSLYAFIGSVAIILLPFILVFHLICLAILICLEHSFWLTQQGTSPTQAFTTAFDTYIKDKHLLLNQILADYLMLKRSDDWFTIKHCPSYDEYTEFRKIVFDNLFGKACPYLFWACVSDTIPSAHPKPSIWYWDFRLSYISCAIWINQQIVNILYNYHYSQLYCAFSC